MLQNIAWDTFTKGLAPTEVTHRYERMHNWKVHFHGTCKNFRNPKKTRNCYESYLFLSNVVVGEGGGKTKKETKEKHANTKILFESLQGRNDEEDGWGRRRRKKGKKKKKSVAQEKENFFLLTEPSFPNISNKNFIQPPTEY
eukprot:TRINITY_DN13161_c0_g3_i2.p2 TRINITY_DN13161_c0_g3~~TRINITY_DN13161_c0_g3_i2.p2  ORF type:complete len:142 (+),score=18.76 TRINITY_DN13161_c0_g3_i2:378-803(+)